jgi:hypothetical protein
MLFWMLGQPTPDYQETYKRGEKLYISGVRYIWNTELRKNMKITAQAKTSQKTSSTKKI